MSTDQPQRCDHTSVGVVIEGPGGYLAMLKRARFPVGIAPVAGHVDLHGTPRLAALAEAAEELGVNLDDEQLETTPICGRVVDNRCRRAGGHYHSWWIYRVALASLVELIPDSAETLGASWCAPAVVADLAARTRAYRSGELSATSWSNEPGLEEVWVEFLTELRYI
ncbi:NUDIX domain-containing protein [Actinosynnema sp. NPDC023794]